MQAAGMSLFTRGHQGFLTRAQADGAQRLFRRLGATDQRIIEAKQPLGPASRNRGCCPDRRTRHKAGGRRVKVELGAGLAVQVNDRVIAAGRADEVTFQRARCACNGGAVAVHGCNHRARHPLGAGCFNQRVVGVERHSQGLQPHCVRSCALRADIDNGNVDTRFLGLDRRRQGHVVVDQKQPLVPGLYTIALQVGFNRAGKHDAGKVVVAEHQRTLKGTGGEHNLLGTDAMPPHARAVVAVGFRHVKVVCYAFQRGQHVVVENARQRGSGQHSHVGGSSQFSLNCGHPEVCIHAVNLNRITQQRSAAFSILLNQHHPRARLRRHAGCLQTRWPRAHHNDVSMLIVAVIARNVGDIVGHTQARSPPDHRLDQPMPHGRADQEGLVVKACWNKPRDHRVNRANVKSQIWKGVDRLGCQALTQLGKGCAVVGFPGAFLIGVDVAIDQRVRLFNTRGHDAAWPVILKRATDQMHTICKQCRSDRVAAKSSVRLTIEGETQWLRPIDASTSGKAEFLCHAPSSACS